MNLHKNHSLLNAGVLHKSILYGNKKLCKF